ncbi:pfkB-like carbohydrate kinase family protein [Striga asiatica]|uniref:PfkB-like carbohydrate kinase family protein n=1 Tax=Striga asiatica TaxID=4170 RepID=A0A5A7NWM6_STRAF|nr:pfkB-like carbohydrate kinase family protein [Striga asiatica]
MHNQVALSLKSNYALFSSSSAKTHQSPRSSPSVARMDFCHNWVLKCRGTEIPAAKQHLNSPSFSRGSVVDDRSTSAGVKDVDVATIGNLCVDIVLSVPKLPPKSLDERKSYMEELSKSPPDKEFWEAGGNSNMAIAAARLGLRVVSIGHVGSEIYGRFLLDVLNDEGIGMVEMDEHKLQSDVIETLSTSYETLLCWVLVDPLQRHGFCSRSDFSEEPAFSWMNSLSIEAKMAIRRSKIIFCNGYGFDELSPKLLMSVLDYAVEVGTSVFFDPGPRGKSLINGTPEERKALDKFLRMSDVLLLTSEEAESLTRTEDPILAGQELLRKGIRTKWVIIKMGPKGSILITPSSISCAPGFKVNVMDTVGCGDSFVAAIAFGFIHKLPLVYTLTIANAVGAATAMGCGAGRNVAHLNQVKELLRRSNLNEDENFWENLLKEHLDDLETMVLTKASVNGFNNRLKRASLQKVVCELLPKLEHAQANQVGAC